MEGWAHRKEEKKRKIDGLYYNTWSILDKPEPRPLRTTAGLPVSQWTQREVLLSDLCFFKQICRKLSCAVILVEVFHAAELHLSCITAVWGAKLASGNTNPLVALSQHVTGDPLWTFKSWKEENFSNNVMDGAKVERLSSKHALFVDFGSLCLFGISSVSTLDLKEVLISGGRVTSQPVWWKMDFPLNLWESLIKWLLWQ